MKYCLIESRIARPTSRKASLSHLVITQKRGEVFVRRCLFREVQGRGHTLVGLLDAVEAVRLLNSGRPISVPTFRSRSHHLIDIAHHHAWRFPWSCTAAHLSGPRCARSDGAPRVARGGRERKAFGKCCRCCQSSDNPSCVTHSTGRGRGGRQGRGDEFR